MLIFASVLTGQELGLTEPDQSMETTQAARLLSENLNAFHILQEKMQIIHRQEKEILDGIDYLRIRNRKKGNRRVGGKDFDRVQKIDLIKQDANSVARLDRIIDKMAKDVRNKDTGALKQAFALIDDLFEKLTGDQT